MISNQILQNTMEGLKAITRVDLCVMTQKEKQWLPRLMYLTNMKMRYLIL